MSETIGKPITEATHVILPDGQPVRAKIFHTQYGDNIRELAGTSMLRIKAPEAERGKIQAALKARDFKTQISPTGEVTVSVTGTMADLEAHVAPLADMLRAPKPPLTDKDIAKLDWDYNLPRKTGGEMEFLLNLSALPPEHQRQMREKFRLGDGVGKLTLYRKNDGTISAQENEVKDFVNQQLLPALVAKALEFEPSGSKFSWEAENDETSYTSRQPLLELAATLQGARAGRDARGDINSLTVEPVRGLPNGGLHALLSDSPQPDVGNEGHLKALDATKLGLS